MDKDEEQRVVDMIGALEHQRNAALTEAAALRAQNTALLRRIAELEKPPIAPPEPSGHPRTGEVAVGKNARRRAV
jgi:hypothetical protein